MKVFDPKKESEKKDFDYNLYFNEKEEDRIEKILKELPKGSSRKGIKGKYIKKKGNVGKLQLKRSYNKYYKCREEITKN